MSQSTYDEWKSTELEDEDADNAELDRRDLEEDQQRNPHAYGLPCPSCNYHALDEATAEVSERMERDGIR